MSYLSRKDGLSLPSLHPVFKDWKLNGFDIMEIPVILVTCVCACTHVHVGMYVSALNKETHFPSIKIN